MHFTKSRFLNPAAHWRAALLAAVAALPLTLAIPTAHAGRYVLITEDDPQESYQFGDTEGVCVAFEKNLKKFEDRPYGMACRRELDPALGFTRPAWEKLDILQHLDLVMDILRYSGWDKTLPADPRPWPERIKDMVEKRHLTLDLTRLDLDRDGKLDNLVRFGFERTCDPKEELNLGKSAGHRRLYVLNPDMTKIDERLSTRTGVEDDVFIFQGHVYTDTFWGMPLPARADRGRDGTLKLFVFNRYGNAPICKFHYFDSASSKGGK